MGLDMYLEGKKYLFKNYEDRSKDTKEDGFRLKEKTLELGYWRKHPNLHGFIVNAFADGKDDCQEIYLNKEEMLKIITAIKQKELPHTEGFFFGASDGSEDEESIKTFQNAIEWLDNDEENTSKYIVYRASW